MSGHSHFHSIKYKKAVTDAKRSKVFSKLAREIVIAAKDGGGDPNFNPKLRTAIEKAKQLDMPTDNIERAIKRGTGELEGVKLESVIYEAYGPEGTAIIIEGITDNKNRALAEIKQILAQNGGKMVKEGAVRWMFDRKGCVAVPKGDKNKEELEMAAIEAGADDTYWHENILDVYTQPEELEKVKKSLEEKGIEIESASLDWVAKEGIEVGEKEKKAIEKLFEALDESETVQEIYSNLKN